MGTFIEIVLKSIFVCFMWYLFLATFGSFVSWDTSEFDMGTWSEGDRFALACWCLLATTLTAIFVIEEGDI